MNNSSDPSKSKVLHNFSENVKLGILSNFTIVELYTMVVLDAKKHPIKRHTLYLEINELAKFEGEQAPSLIKKKSTENLLLQSLVKTTDLSTSSFYSSLVKLESLDLIKFNKNKKGKIETVEAKPQIRYAINLIYNSLLRLRMMTDLNLPMVNGQEFLEKYNITHLNNILLVLNQEGIELSMLDEFHKISDELFILSEDESINQNINQVYEDIKFTKIYNNLIREPENVFEACLFRLTRKNKALFGLTQSDLIKEFIRVVKKGGRIVITSRADFPETENKLSDFVLKSYKESIKDFIYSEREIKNLLEKAELEQIEVINIDGILFGSGTVT